MTLHVSSNVYGPATSTSKWLSKVRPVLSLGTQCKRGSAVVLGAVFVAGLSFEQRLFVGCLFGSEVRVSQLGYDSGMKC